MSGLAVTVVVPATGHPAAPDLKARLDLFRQCDQRRLRDDERVGAFAERGSSFNR